MLDASGKYGMCEHCAAIVAPLKHLNPIFSAVKSAKFIGIIRMCGVGGLASRYNRKVMSLLRRDFWKDFVDEKGNELP